MPLATLGVIIGSGVGVLGLCLLLAPGFSRRGIAAFPRSAWAGRLLTALDLVWVTYLLFLTPLGRFEGLKFLLWALCPLSFMLVVFFVDELLAPRALGGLFLLAAAPILESARWHESPWRLVMTVLAYAFVVKGMILVMAPFRFRQAGEVLTGTDRACRWSGGAALALGALIIVLGAFVY